MRGNTNFKGSDLSNPTVYSLYCDETYLEIFKAEYIKNSNRRVVTVSFDASVDSLYNPSEGACIQRHCQCVSGIFRLKNRQAKRIFVLIYVPNNVINLHTTNK